MSDRPDSEERLFRGYTGRLFVLVTVAYLALKVGQRLLPPMLPSITTDLMISPFEAGIALSLMAVMRAVLQFPSGRYSDRLSRTSILLAGIVCGLAGFVLMGLTPTYAAFLLSLAVLGAGLGLFDPAARALLSDMFTAKRGRAFGVHFFAGDFAGVAAAVLSILFVSSWQSAFLPSIVLLVPIPFLLIRWSRESSELRWIRIDVGDTIRRLFSVAELRWAVLAYALIVFASIGITSFLAEFLVAVHGFSVEFAGAAFLVLYIVGSVVKPFAGWLADRMASLTVVTGSVLLGSGSLLALILAPSRWFAIAAIVFYAFGLRSFPPPFHAYLMDRFPDESMGGDLGAVRSVYMIIGSLGPAYVGFIASRYDFSIAYASVILCFVMAAVITYRLPE